MKNTFAYFFFLILCSGFLFSCGDDDNEPQIQSAIEGNWSLQSMKYNGKYFSYLQGELSDEGTMAGDASDINMVFKFSGNKLVATGSFTMGITYGLFPDVEFKAPVSGSTYTSTFELTDDKIYFHSEGGVEEARIISHTDSKLVLQMVTSSSIEAFGGKNVMEYDGVYVMTK